MKTFTRPIGRVAILVCACMSAHADVIMIDNAEVGEGFAGYFGFAAGSRYATPYSIFNDPISATQNELTAARAEPLIDQHYTASRIVDQGAANSRVEIDAKITSVAGMPNLIRSVDLFMETSAMAPSPGDSVYFNSALVQFAFLFEVTDEPTTLRASGALFAEPYASTELRISRMDADTFVPGGLFPVPESNVFRSRTLSDIDSSSARTVDVTTELDPGLYHFYASTSTLRGGFTPGASFATHNTRVVFGGGLQRWIDPAGGLFSDGENWESGEMPSASAPVLFDLVNDGYVVDMDMDASVASMRVTQGTVSLAFNGNAGNAIAVDGEVTVGETAGVRGGLDIIGGSMSAGSVLVARASGADGLLTLREGAVLEFDSLLIGQADSAAAQFYAISGASLSVGADDVIAVSGSNSSFRAEHLAIGEAGTGRASFNIDQGAIARIDGDLEVAAGQVSVSGSVDGLSSNLQVATERGDFTIAAEGGLTVADGGFLQVGDEFFNANGDLIVNAAPQEPIEVHVSADYPGAPPPASALPEAAVRIVGTDSLADVAATVAIGAASTSGMQVSGGARLRAGRIVLGSPDTAGVDGFLLVRDAGTTVEATAMTVGDHDLGEGTLRVEGGASVTLARSLDILNGEVRVAGGAAPGAAPQLLVGTGLDANVDVARQGRLYVTDGASAQIGNSVFDLSADLFVNADSADADPAPVLVSGDGSSLRVFGLASIGSIDNGYMAVTAGASFEAREIVLGSRLFDGVAGQLDVVGAGSEVFTQDIILGDEPAGAGTLTIADGAAVDVVRSLLVSRSSVFVDGSGDGMASRLFVGEAHPEGGEITVREGSRFVVSHGGNVEVGALVEQSARVVVDTSAPSSEPAPFLVTGNGSRMHVAGSLAIGLFDNGVAGVTDGGELIASEIAIAGGPGVTAELSVTGPDSTLDANRVTVGGATGGVGTLALEEGSQARIQQRLLVNENGAVYVRDDSGLVIGPDPLAAVAGSVVVGPGGEIWGTGDIYTSIVTAGGVNNLGTVRPGSSPGVLTIHGDYLQGDTGVLVIEVGGIEAGLEHDVLNVLGDATIGGEVLFEFIDGFLPRRGEVFDFLAVEGDVDLTLATFTTANLGDGFAFEIQAFENGFRMLAMSDATAVPLPASAGLFLAAIGLLTAARRPSRHAA